MSNRQMFPLGHARSRNSSATSVKRQKDWQTYVSKVEQYNQYGRQKQAQQIMLMRKQAQQKEVAMRRKEKSDRAEKAADSFSAKKPSREADRNPAKMAERTAASRTAPPDPTGTSFSTACGPSRVGVAAPAK